MRSQDFPIETIQESIDVARIKSVHRLFELVVEERKKLDDHDNQGRPLDRGLNSRFVLMQIIKMLNTCYTSAELVENGGFPELLSKVIGLLKKEIIFTAPMVDYLEKETDFFEAADNLEKYFRCFKDDRTVEALEDLMNALSHIHGGVRNAEFFYLGVDKKVDEMKKKIDIIFRDASDYLESLARKIIGKEKIEQQEKIYQELMKNDLRLVDLQTQQDYLEELREKLVQGGSQNDEVILFGCLLRACQILESLAK